MAMQKLPSALPPRWRNKDSWLRRSVPRPFRMARRGCVSRSARTIRNVTSEGSPRWCSTRSPAGAFRSDVSFRHRDRHGLRQNSRRCRDHPRAWRQRPPCPRAEASDVGLFALLARNIGCRTSSSGDGPASHRRCCRRNLLEAVHRMERT